jgi:hypothetical protein
MPEPVLHMAERVLVGHQLDRPFAAVAIQLLRLLRSDGGSVLPDGSMCGVGKGVLRVQLDLVELQLRPEVDQMLEGFHGRYPVTADIEHHPPSRELRPVLDMDAGDPACFVRLADQLPQRHESVVKSLPASGDQGQVIRANRQPVALLVLGRAGVHAGADPSRTAGSDRIAGQLTFEACRNRKRSSPSADRSWHRD